MAHFSTRHSSHGPRASRRLFLTTAGTAGLLACGLTACGSSSSGATTSSSAGTAAKGATTTISLSMQNADVKTLDPATYDIVAAFEKANPTIKVDLQGQPVDQHEQQMTIAAQSGTLPDIFWVYNSLAQTMVKNNNLLDLGPIMKSQSLTSKFSANNLSGFQANGVQYGLPYQELITGFYYNKALFAKYNVAFPETFDQLLAAAKVFKKNNVVTIAQGANQSDFSVWAFLTMLDRFGYQDVYQDILNGKGSFNNPQFLRLFQHIKELQQAGAFPSNVSTQTYNQSVQSFISGSSAMLDCGVWAASQIQAASFAKQVGFWWGPTFSDGVGNQKVKMQVPSAPFVVSAKVKSDPAKYSAVEKFLGFYYSDAAAAIMVKDGQPPVTTAQPAVDATKNSVFATVLAQAKDPGYTSPPNQPDLVLSATSSAALYQAIYGVMEGVYSPSQALDLVQQSLKH